MPDLSDRRALGEAVAYGKLPAVRENDDPVTKVARDLRAIVDLSGDLEDQAGHAGGDMPGGTAMVMLGPVANLEAWGNVLDGAERWNASEERERLRLPTVDLAHVYDEADDYEPPLQTLLFWTEAWRVEHNRETDRRPTVATEAAFAGQLLQWAWEHEPRWDDFARDVHEARTRIEATLKAGIRVERSKTHCIDCEGVRLVKHYHAVPDLDYHRCPRCSRRYDRGGLIRAQHQELASAGADRWVPVSVVYDAIERPRRKVAAWVEEARTVCDLETRWTMVWWPDIRDMERAAKVRDALRRAQAAS